MAILLGLVSAMLELNLSAAEVIPSFLPLGGYVIEGEVVSSKPVAHNMWLLRLRPDALCGGPLQATLDCEVSTGEAGAVFAMPEHLEGMKVVFVARRNPQGVLYVWTRRFPIFPMEAPLFVVTEGNRRAEEGVRRICSIYMVSSLSTCRANMRGLVTDASIPDFQRGAMVSEYGFTCPRVDAERKNLYSEVLGWRDSPELPIQVRIPADSILAESDGRNIEAVKRRIQFLESLAKLAATPEDIGLVRQRLQEVHRFMESLKADAPK